MIVPFLAKPLELDSDTTSNPSELTKISIIDKWDHVRHIVLHLKYGLIEAQGQLWGEVNRKWKLWASCVWGLILSQEWVTPSKHTCERAHWEHGWGLTVWQPSFLHWFVATLRQLQERQVQCGHKAYLQWDDHHRHHQRQLGWATHALLHPQQPKDIISDLISSMK